MVRYVNGERQPLGLPGMKLKLLHWHKIGYGYAEQWKLSTRKTDNCDRRDRCIPLFNGDDLVATLAAGKRSREAVVQHTLAAPVPLPEVIVEVSGGIVDNIYSNVDGLQASVVDWDLDNVVRDIYNVAEMATINRELLFVLNQEVEE